MSGDRGAGETPTVERLAALLRACRVGGTPYPPDHILSDEHNARWLLTQGVRLDVPGAAGAGTDAPPSEPSAAAIEAAYSAQQDGSRDPMRVALRAALEEIRNRATLRLGWLDRQPKAVREANDGSEQTLTNVVEIAMTALGVASRGPTESP